MPYAGLLTSQSTMRTLATPCARALAAAAATLFSRQNPANSTKVAVILLLVQAIAADPESIAPWILSVSCGEYHA